MNSLLISIDQTIYCLLIHPNPDSALNATAGHLLQDDYDSFARQARLMTSIHAKIPSELQEAAIVAKRRGETAGTAIGEVTDQRPTMKGKHPTQLASSNFRQMLDGEDLADEDEEDEFASKENDPLLSPSPVPVPSPRRPSMAKRPLSDLYTVEAEHDMTDAAYLSPSEQNVINNGVSLLSTAASDSSWKGPQLAGKGQDVRRIGCGLEEIEANGTSSADIEERPSKRICPSSGKENTLETLGLRILIETPLSAIDAATRVEVPISKQASTMNSAGPCSVKGKTRVGLRRL